MKKYVVICRNKEQCMKFLLATYPDRVVTTFEKDWFKCGIIQSVDDNKTLTHVSWKTCFS